MDDRIEIIHSSIGVYLNGERVHNGVADVDLVDHIRYNIAFRPGRALFINGVCRHQGYLSKKLIEAVEADLENNPHLPKTVTRPYR